MLRNVNPRPGAGFSLVELLVAMAIMVIILAIAIPSVENARRYADETAVVREIQTIHQAQMQYQSQFGKYAAALAELGPPVHGASGPQGASLIPRSLARGERNGYVFAMNTTPLGYTVSAVPKAFGSSGRRTFYMDQNGVIHQNWGRDPATENDPDIE